MGFQKWDYLTNFGLANLSHYGNRGKVNNTANHFQQTGYLQAAGTFSRGDQFVHSKTAAVHSVKTQQNRPHFSGGMGKYLLSKELWHRWARDPQNALHPYEYGKVVKSLADTIAQPRKISQFDEAHNDPTNSKPLLKTDEALNHYAEIQAIDFKSLDGTPLKGYWWLPKNKDPKKILVMGHGWTSHWTTNISLAEKLRKQGVGVLMFSFRGHNESGGKYTTVGFTEGQDLAAAIQQAKNKYPTLPRFYYGHSMGASTVLMTPESLGRSSKYKRAFIEMINSVDGWVLDTPFHHVRFEKEIDYLVDNLISSLKKDLVQPRSFNNYFMWEGKRKFLYQLEHPDSGFVGELARFISQELVEKFPVTSHGKQVNRLEHLSTGDLSVQSPLLISMPMMFIHGRTDETTPFDHLRQIVDSQIRRVQQNNVFQSEFKSQGENGLPYLQKLTMDGVGHHGSEWDALGNGTLYTDVLRHDDMVPRILNFMEQPWQNTPADKAQWRKDWIEKHSRVKLAS